MEQNSGIFRLIRLTKNPSVHTRLRHVSIIPSVLIFFSTLEIALLIALSPGSDSAVVKSTSICLIIGMSLKVGSLAPTSGTIVLVSALIDSVLILSSFNAFFGKASAIVLKFGPYSQVFDV